MYNFDREECGAFEGKNAGFRMIFIFTKFILVRTSLKSYLLFA
jgi:hypothetical protein